MKKKHLNEGCTYEHEETMPPHAEFISVDEVNRYMLQMTDEEQDTMSFRDVIAGIMRTKPESIKKMKRAGAGWKVWVSGNMDDLLDDNADVLKRLKDSDETTYTPDNLDDDFMWNDEEEETSEFSEITDKKTFHHFMQAYDNGDLSLDIEVNGKPAEAYMTKGNGVCLETSAGKIYTKFIQRVEIKRTGNSWEGWIGANGFKLRFNAELWEDEDEENDDLEDLMIGGEVPGTDENEWMTPEEMGIAQKIDWSDDMGDDISDEEKMAYFQSKSDMYDVNMENGLVRLKPEDDWFDDDIS